MIRKSCALAATLLVLNRLTASAQAPSGASLRVHVLDAATNQALAGAQVGFPGLKLFTLSDAAGDAVLSEAPQGDHQLEVTMLGYGRAASAVHLGPGAIAAVTVKLGPEAIVIDGITVEGHRISASLRERGFYNRARGAPGLFLDEWALDSLHITTLGDVLRKRSNPECMSFGLTTPKRLTIYVNGTPAEPSSLPGYTMFRGIEKIDMHSFEGVEFYNKPSEAPPQFSGECEVLLLWMK